MEQPEHCLSFNQKQREMFARLLQQARKRAEAELESDDSGIDARVKAEVVPKLAEERGALGLVAKVRGLHSQVEEAEKALGALGFDCDEDEISLKWNAPKELQEALAQAKRVARKEREAPLRKYDCAILGVWAAESLSEARKIVEDLL